MLIDYLNFFQKLCFNTDSKIQTLLQQGLNDVESLAFDYIGRNLYWIDAGKKRIEMMKTDGTNRRIILNDTTANLDKPRSIALAPKLG